MVAHWAETKLTNKTFLSFLYKIHVKVKDVNEEKNTMFLKTGLGSAQARIYTPMRDGLTSFEDLRVFLKRGITHKGMFGRSTQVVI